MVFRNSCVECPAALLLVSEGVFGDNGVAFLCIISFWSCLHILLVT